MRFEALTSIFRRTKLVISRAAGISILDVLADRCADLMGAATPGHEEGPGTSESIACGGCARSSFCT